ncbi:MAG: alpha-N-acetylglucosaminidase [Bacteroidaceae bacterium]|nr:alpha-N-acetylglucosaminidase [Bacteroidaceae bacterium]
MKKPILSTLLSLLTITSWAFTSHTSVQVLPEETDNKTSYQLISARGALYSDTGIEPSSLTSNCQTGRNQNVSNVLSDKRFQFLILKATDIENGFYIYSVETQKFIRQDGFRAAYTDRPSVIYIWKHGATGSKNNDYGKNYKQEDYPWLIGNEESYGPYQTINVCCWDTANPDYRWCSTGSLDGGNEFSIAKAGTVADDIWQDAHDKVVEFEKSQQEGTTDDEELDSAKVLSPEDRAQQEKSALDIINRFTKGDMQVEVILDLCRTVKDCERYAYSASTDMLTIHASGAIAACRGFYDYVKAKGAGFCSWSGSRFARPDDMSCKETSLICQFRDHQYFNVVTYGYTMPYWTKERWNQEIDWMALHGVDMPLMLVGSEYIYRQVFKEMGLTDKEIDEWEVGPAHLPWFRMGNLAGNSFDGPLGDEWNIRQKALAHHLLDRMRALGMKPVCPAFGGFVPKAFTKHVTGSSTENTGWNWVPANYRNYRLNPGSKAFVTVGTKFIQKWEEEYGVSKYYLSDSFNEMTIPTASTLTQYGDNIYKCIKDGSMNPEAVWVTQGWTFVYQSNDWGNTKFKALTKNVPDDRFMVLYMSPEYGPSKCWEKYEGFNGKQWNYTMLPNMGGKTFWTGNLNNYAKNYLTDLYNSPMQGNCTGFGMTPEGTENNEMLYELITDAGWTAKNATINLDKWFTQYANARYGCYPDEMKKIHKVLRQTVYNRYIDHPRFGWQMGGNLTGAGSANLATGFYTGVETLFSSTDALKAVNTPLLENDLIELAVLYTSGRIESSAQQIKNTNDKTEAARLIAELDELMLDLDAALELHPNFTLRSWEDKAQENGDSQATKTRNAKNARRIVTVWYGNHTSDEPVQDYAARLWSGLVRDFYRPRLINQLMADKGLTSGWNRISFENNFVNSAPELSEPRSVTGDHIEFLARLVNHAKNFGNIEIEPLDKIEASTDLANHWYTFRNAEISASEDVLTTNGDNSPACIRAGVNEGSQVWRVISTGDGIFRIEGRWGENISVANGKAMTFYAPIRSDVRFNWATDGSKHFAIVPLAGNDVMPANTWQVEPVASALVPEAKSEDYARYIRRLAGFTQTDIFGQVGQPRSAASLENAIARLQKEGQNIDHKTYDTFLAQWAALCDTLITKSEDINVGTLVNLIMSAHQIIVPADAQTSELAATLFEAIQTAEKAAARKSDAAKAIADLETAILTYYAAGGQVTDTPIESLVPESTGLKMKIKAVFPNGKEHVVYSDGNKLTAASTTPGKAVSEFDIIEMDGVSYVLKAGGQYIHWTSGDDTSKSEDLDGLNEDFDSNLNTLTIRPGTTDGIQSTTWSTKPISSLCEIVGNGTNGQRFNFTLREKDNCWVAGNPGMKFFDTNWDGVGCRTSFFRIELIEPDNPTSLIGVGATNRLADPGHISDLQGRRVTRPTHGIFIKNGKKVLL